jgi:hypothetical protein
LKLSEVDSKLFQPGIFSDFKNAFIGSDIYKLADIPLKYQGLQMLMTRQGFN